MTARWTRLDTMECILLAAGAAALMVWISVTTRRKAWRALLQLPAPIGTGLQPLDAAVGFLLRWGLPMLVFRAIASPAADEATPSTAPSGDALPTNDQIIASAAGQALAVCGLLAIGAIRLPGGWAGWGLDFARGLKRLGQAVLIYVAFWPVCFGIMHLTLAFVRVFDAGFEPREHSTILTLLSDAFPANLRFLTVFTALILAPVTEELLFRGILQPVLVSAARNPWAGIVLAGTAFGLLHAPLAHTVPALAMFGCVLGYLYARTGSLLLPILLHVIFNGKTLLWLAIGST